MTPAMDDLLKYLIAEQLGNHSPYSPKEQVSPDGEPDRMINTLLRYAGTSPANSQRLMVPGGCLRFAMLMMSGLTVYRLIELSGMAPRADNEPLRIFHAGADWMTALNLDFSCRAFRSLFPELPILEHTLVGPEMASPFDDERPLGPSFFPEIPWRAAAKRRCHEGTLTEVFDANPALAKKVHAGHFHAALFLNPGFIEGNGYSWLSCDATIGLLGNAGIPVLGCSQNTYDFYRDKVFLGGFSRAIKGAHENRSTPVAPGISGGCWGGVLWVTEPQTANDSSGPVPGCLPVCSVGVDHAMTLLDEFESSAAWQNVEDRCTMFPGEWVDGSAVHFRITPSIVFDVEAGVFLADSPFGRPTEIRPEPMLTATVLDRLANGDYWGRLDFAVYHMDELNEMIAPSFDAGLFPGLTDLMEQAGIDENMLQALRKSTGL